jgi:hypothetical protein
LSALFKNPNPTKIQFEISQTLDKTVAFLETPENKTAKPLYSVSPVKKMASQTWLDLVKIYG